MDPLTPKSHGEEVAVFRHGLIGAIALALEAYGRGETSISIRRRVSPSATVGGSACERWVTLVRWIDTARSGRLFAVSGLGELPRRRVAEHVAFALAGRAGRALGEDLAEEIGRAHV